MPAAAQQIREKERMSKTVGSRLTEFYYTEPRAGIIEGTPFIFFKRALIMWPMLYTGTDGGNLWTKRAVALQNASTVRRDIDIKKLL